MGDIYDEFAAAEQPSAVDLQNGPIAEPAIGPTGGTLPAPVPATPAKDIYDQFAEGKTPEDIYDQFARGEMFSPEVVEYATSPMAGVRLPATLADRYTPENAQTTEDYYAATEAQRRQQRPLDYVGVLPDTEVVNLVEANNADPNYVLTPDEYLAFQKAKDRLPVGEKVKRFGNMLGVGWQGVSEMGAAIGKDFGIDLAPYDVNGKVKAIAHTVNNFPSSGVAGAGRVALTALQYLGRGDRGWQGTDNDEWLRLIREADYQNYILDKGVALMRKELDDNPVKVPTLGTYLSGGLIERQFGKPTEGATAIVEMGLDPTNVAAGAIPAMVGKSFAGKVVRKVVASGAPRVATVVPQKVAAGVEWLTGGFLKPYRNLNMAKNAIGMGSFASMGATAPVMAAVAPWVAKIYATNLTAKMANKIFTMADDGVKFAQTVAKEGLKQAPESALKRVADNIDLPMEIRKRAAKLDANPMRKTAQFMGSLGGSAVDGAAINYALTLALTGDQDQAAASIPMGLAFGAAGRSLAPKNVADMRAYDAERMYAHVDAVGGDVEGLAQMPKDMQAEMAAWLPIYGKSGALFTPLRGEAYAKALEGAGLGASTKGAFVGSDKRVYLNLDKIASTYGFHHEMGHAIGRSQVLDGFIAEDINPFVHQLYGDNLNVIEQKYAAKFVEADTRKPATPEQIAAVIEAFDASDSGNGFQPKQWVRDEAWAETMVDASRRFDPWQIRDGANDGLGALRAVGDYLKKRGVPINSETGKVEIDSPLFGKLMGQMNDKALKRRISEYMKAHRDWLTPAMGQEPSQLNAKAKRPGFRTFSPEQFRNDPRVPLTPTPKGTLENEFLREKGGILAYKDQKEINATYKTKQQLGEDLRGRAKDVPYGSTEMGYQKSVDGTRILAGRKIEDAYLAALHSASPWEVPKISAIEKSIEQKGTVRVDNHAVGTREDGKKSHSAGPYKVKQTIASGAPTHFEARPFRFILSGADKVAPGAKRANNLLVELFDMDQFRKNAIRAQEMGLLDSFAGDLGEVWKDFNQLLDNYQNDRVGTYNIDPKRKDMLNALIGLQEIERNAKANALAAQYKFKSTVKTTRLDRITRIQEGKMDGLQFSYDKAAINAMPDTPRAAGDATQVGVEDGGRNLAVVHNISEAGLRNVMKIGGIPVPSLAIVRTDKGLFDNFGEITLIAKPDLIDPKVKSNKVFNADIYSPRYPSVETELSSKSVKSLETLLKDTDAATDGGYSGTIDAMLGTIKNEGIQSALENHPRVMLKYLQEKGVNVTLEGLDRWGKRDALRKTIQQNDEGAVEFAKWVSDLQYREGWDTKERIFDGYTYSGRKKFLAHSLDAVVRILKRDLKDGEGFNYGAPGVRAVTAKKFRSIEQIQKDRNSIVPKQEMDSVKEGVNQEFADLAEKIAPHRDLSNFSDDMKALAQGGQSNYAYLREMYPDGVPFKEMSAFLEKLKSLPTEYFEAKIQRAVQLQEFEKAVVPDSTPAEIMDMLKRSGIDVVPYKSRNTEDRARAFRQATQSNDIRFMPDNGVDAGKGVGDKRAAGVKTPQIKGVVESFQDSETGLEMKTGQPITFNYVHNPVKSPNFGDRYQQDIEPAGRFVSPISGNGGETKGYNYGQITFKSPLILEWGSGYDATGWKKRLSDAFGGKKGRALSRAIYNAGYDGIITTSALKSGVQYASETVDLRWVGENGKPRTPLPSSALDALK